MGFFSDLFGGPSTQEKELASRQSTLAATMAANYGERFGEQSDIFKNLTNQLTPLANMGPNAQGFSPQELSAMNAAAISSSGAAARNAKQAVATALAGRGGGSSSGLVSGIDAQIQGTVASAAANQLAAAQNEIVQRNYETGRQNFWNATAGEHALATAEAPQQYGQLAETSTQSALADAEKIQQEKQAAAFAPISLGMKALGGAASFITGGLSNVASGGREAGTESGGGLEQFFSGGMAGLSQ